MAGNDNIELTKRYTELQILFWFEEYFTHWTLLKWVLKWGVKYDEKRNKDYFFIQQHESFIDLFFLTLRSHSSAECSRTKYNNRFIFSVSFYFDGYFNSFFKSNITPQIFYQWVFAIFTCIFHAKNALSRYLEHWIHVFNLHLYEALAQCWVIVGPSFSMLAQHYTEPWSSIIKFHPIFITGCNSNSQCCIYHCSHQ